MTRQKTEHYTSTRTHQPRGSTRRFAQRRRRTSLHATRGRLDAGSRHQLPPPALDRAPPPPLGLSASDRAPLSEIPGPGHPCRPLGLGICGGAGLAGARRRQPDDSTPTWVWRRYRAGEDRCAGGVPDSEKGATSPRPIGCVGCGGSYRGPLAFAAPAGCRTPATTTRERRLLQGHRRVHGVCIEGRLLLSVGDRGGGNGLRPPFVREAGVAASGRPFGGSGLDSLDCTPYAGQTRAASTFALAKALLMAHDEDAGPVFGRTPEEELAEQNRGKQRRSDSRDRGDCDRGSGGKDGVGGDHRHRRGGDSGGGGGEVHRVLVWLRAPPRGQLWSNNRGSWPQLWRRQRRAEKSRERTFSMGRLVNLPPFVFVLEHGPQRGGRSRHEVSGAMAEGASGPEVFTLLLRLLMSHFEGLDTEESYTELHTFGMCNGMPFSDYLGSFAYVCRPLRGVSVFCLRGRMWRWRWLGWRRMSNVRLSCLRCTLVRRQRTRGYTPRWMLCGGLLVTKRIIRHLPSTAQYLFLSLFRRERGHPPRRGPGPPIMDAARVECRPSRFRGRRDRAILQLSCPSMIHLTLGLTTHRTAGH